MIKECIYCKKEKNIWEFRVDKNNTTWVKDYCKDCTDTHKSELQRIKKESSLSKKLHREKIQKIKSTNKER